MQDYHQRFRETFDFIDCSALNGTEILAFIDEVVAETKEKLCITADDWIWHGRDKERAALIEKVEGMKYQQPLLGTPETTERVMKAVNETLDDLLTYLRANPTS